MDSEKMSYAAILNEASHLLDSEDPKERLRALTEVTEQYNTKEITSTERKLAEQMFRVLMHDAETSVRKALSEHLKSTNVVPKDIILQLVDDVDEVAVPVLKYSEVLDDNDLLEIIKNSDSAEKFLAISNRKVVNENVSDALIDTKQPKVVKNLLQRTAAKISEFSLGKVISTFAENHDVMDSMAQRENLPASVVEKVIKKVGGNMHDLLVKRYGHVMPNISEIVEKSQEAATLKFMGMKSSVSEIKSMVDNMDKTAEIAQNIYENNVELTKTIETLQTSGRLGPISALCMGNLELFAISVARITNVPVANVRKLLHDESGHGLEALYKRAKLPENIFSATKLVVKVINDLDKEIKEKSSVKKTGNELITRLLKAAEDEKRETENLSYFISMIHKHSKMDNK